ncbi:diphthamide biosynthesis enzyme Dph2 [Thermofilum pendens]|uniref:2-(3-amino-3-carboxypropyl)histidine synthase n=1 Tax=Thermofilum pendens (strain DSM 2475 / Hrk 5) TaxID=368408 RepID=A1RYK3_THEPD|nr:diphthamide biosynthesis enzyme Dph2 [Thermofilum pendens]ABL78283.1 diphthamide biosynthesis protein [Thermofilum pendens Hrk 5]
MEAGLSVGGYEVDLRPVREIRKLGARRVLLQAPDGLKHVARELAARLAADGVEAYVSGGHAWGGCDVALQEARAINADAILHLGHHGFVGARVDAPPVIFVPVYYEGLLFETFEKVVRNVALKGYRRVTIGTTYQHAKYFSRLVRLAEDAGLTVAGRHLDGYLGLVVGCNYAALAEDAEAVIVVAGGVFHALGAALWTGAPTWRVDPYTGDYGPVDVKPIVARRLRDLSRAIEARSFLVAVSSKTGQRRPEIARRIRDLLAERGLRAELAVFDEVTREGLLNLGSYDAYVNTACPRLAVDDPDLFPGPVVNPGELKYVLKGSLEGYSPRDLFRFDVLAPP